MGTKYKISIPLDCKCQLHIGLSSSQKNKRNKKNKEKISITPFAKLISCLLISLHIQSNDCPELHTYLTLAMFDKREMYFMLKCSLKGAVGKELYVKLIFHFLGEDERKEGAFLAIYGYKLKLDLCRFP